MRRMLVRKLDTLGRTVVTYEGILTEEQPYYLRLEAEWSRPTLELDYTTFETGDRFIEWYYTDRWYNIFEIHGAAGDLKGWYCNVAEPAVIQSDVILCRDLLLDLWVAPSGHLRVLDEDEFEADEALDAATRAQALHALDELIALVAARMHPFQVLPVHHTPSETV